MRTNVGRASARHARADGLKPVLHFVVIILLMVQVANACPTCYGDPNSPMTKGSNNAILFLLGIIGFVQVGFIGLFVTFWRRARALRRRRESLRVLDGGMH
jgi:Na+/proline symporter